MKTIYHDPVTGITVKTGNDWPIRISLLILAVAAGATGWSLGHTESPVVETMSLSDPVIEEEPLPPLEIKPNQTSRTSSISQSDPQLHSSPQQKVHNEPKVEVNVYNMMRGGDTTVTTRLEQLKEQFAAMTKQTSSMSFEQYDRSLAMLSTGADLNDPTDFRRALTEMARISTEYWGFNVNATTDDVFNRWHQGLEEYKKSHPEFESALLTTGQSAFRSVFDDK